MRLGVSKIDITPAKPVPLAGFSNRKGAFEGVDSRIYAKVFAFEQMSEAGSGVERAVLILADLLWWGTDQMDRLRNSLRISKNLDDSRIMFCASHNHSGPQMSYHFPSLGKPDEEYLRWMENEVLLGVDAAFRELD